MSLSVTMFSLRLMPPALRMLRAAAVSTAALCVALIAAAAASFILMLALSHAALSGLDESFVLAFANAFPIGLLAAVITTISLLRPDTRKAMRLPMLSLAGLVALLGVVELVFLIWTRDEDSHKQLDAAYLAGGVLPGLVVVSTQFWAVRVFLWAFGGRSL